MKLLLAIVLICLGLAGCCRLEDYKIIPQTYWQCWSREDGNGEVCSPTSGANEYKFERIKK